jgi:hypothetical protein
LQAGDKDEDGDRQYSSYAELGTHFNLMGVEISPGIGISPWKGLYSDGFGLNEISVKATKQIKISDSFSLPLYAKGNRCTGARQCVSRSRAQHCERD